MRLPHRTTVRRGASLIETAGVIAVFLILVLGMLDLGIGVFRYHLVSHAARQGARMVIVHGSMASKLGTWAPPSPGTPFTTKGDGTDPIAQAMQPYLTGLNRSEVTITVTWMTGTEPDGTNRVQVEVNTPYRPMMTFLVRPDPLTLSASSTMYIAH